jgi:hypothetical protein
VLRIPFVIIALVVSVGVTAAHASQASDWGVVSSGADLLRPVYWEGVASAEIKDGMVTITPIEAEGLTVLRYGPRVRARSDFGLVVSLQTSSPDLGGLALVDALPEEHWWDGMRRLELGIQHGVLVVSVFDGTSMEPTAQDAIETVPQGEPLTVEIRRVGGDYTVLASGNERLRFADPGLFPTGEMLLATQVQGETALTVHHLSVWGSTTSPDAVRIDRCAPDRLLIAGSDRTNVETGLWWLWPDQSLLRQIESSVRQTSSLVAVSPDARWATYYQRSPLAPPDRFIVDTWVLDLASDQRHKLVEQTLPLGWIPDSSAVILGSNPNLMARVPSGELVPTDQALVTTDAMKAVRSPNGQFRAVVTTGIMGAATGIDVFDLTSQELVMHIVTGRGAITMAWSPDSARLAFTSSAGGQLELLWRLQIADIPERRVMPVETTSDLQVHSVAWVPSLPGCR